MNRTAFIPSRKSLESVTIPTAAFLVSMALFGGFCVLWGAPFWGVFASIYRAGFGSL
jgi:hypothetical protein